jgi:hypothetical protein
MRKTFAPLFLLGLLSVLVAQQPPVATQPLLVLTHATVIDMTGGPAKPDVTVIVTGDRITQMGKSREIHLPEDAQVVDATGKFLIPGLWDMHVHWYDKGYLPLFIANGVTRIRVMWGGPLHHQWRKEIEAGALLGPRMVIASAIVDGPKPQHGCYLAVNVRGNTRLTSAAIGEVLNHARDLVSERNGDISLVIGEAAPGSGHHCGEGDVTVLTPRVEITVSCWSTLGCNLGIAGKFSRFCIARASQPDYPLGVAVRVGV